MNRFLYGWLCGLIPATLIQVITIFIILPSIGSESRIETELMEAGYNITIKSAIEKGLTVSQGECVWDSMKDAYKNDLYDIHTWVIQGDTVGLRNWMDKELTDTEWDDCIND